MTVDKLKRSFTPTDLVFEWKFIQPFYEELTKRTINSRQELIFWLKDRSELSAVLEEEYAWRYIRMNIDTTNENLKESFQYFVTEINPKIAPFEDQLNRKFNDSEFKKELTEKKYQNLLRTTQSQIELFREENIPLFTQVEEKSQKYGAISAQMSIIHKQKEYTLQQAATFLKSTDRMLRKEIYHSISERRLTNQEELDSLFNDLLKLRQEIAKNAGFKNYLEYKFKALGRFDYTIQDCINFHESIKQSAVPLNDFIDTKRKELLALDSLKPWDMQVDISGKNPLKPFENGNELLNKTKACFKQIDPFFETCLSEMETMGHLDLESKKGKAPGGFNYPLYESGYPFIFMNAAGSLRDVTTLVHEGGHAVHSVLTHDLELVDFKGVPSEVAELASMSMELISMDYWDAYFDNDIELKRAKRDQLLDVISTLPWVAAIDKFQHWIYQNEGHSNEERTAEWNKIINEFGSSITNWDGLERVKSYLWQKQLHLYEVPLYYIEYGMAQLGAIAIWRNYRKDPENTIKQYKEALSLGYTKSINEIYETAGIKFDFSAEYVQELMDFVSQEIKQTFN